MSGFLPDYHAADVMASPNFGDRRDGCAPDMLILHYTGMPSAEGALDWLLRPESEVSSHYFVFEDGRIIQLVPENARAWHAGRSCWKGETDVNSASIGIEIVNPGHPGGLPDFPEVQIAAVIGLCCDVIGRHAIMPERVLGHSDVAPVRKIDPGERFPWATLASAGVGHWVEPSPVGGGRYFQLGDAGPPVEALQAMLALYGYDVPVSGEYCVRTQGVIEAFQRHFRQDRVDGIADASTIETLHRLLKSLPGT
ncbi:MAG: N-acetylmuramoyl-L-alanine amidase [Rhizobium sp.]|nr:N-acetylmuramoyl-L-alanine amidase [Rhizobium sp.]